jgi:hypothetical protein
MLVLVELVAELVVLAELVVQLGLEEIQILQVLLEAVQQHLMMLLVQTELQESQVMVEQLVALVV